MEKTFVPVTKYLVQFLNSAEAGSHLENQWKIRRPQRKSSARQEMRLDAGQGLWHLKRINMWRIEDKRLAKSWPLFYAN